MGRQWRQRAETLIKIICEHDVGVSLSESGAPPWRPCEPVQLFIRPTEPAVFFIGLKEKLIPGCQPEFGHKLNIGR